MLAACIAAERSWEGIRLGQPETAIVLTTAPGDATGDDPRYLP